MHNISRSKGNQTMKFGPILKYNMRNIFFFEKSHTKCGGENTSRLSSKKAKTEHIGINNLKFFTVCFYFMQG